LAATAELAQALPLNEATRVIDIGSGLGGPSRYLAETCGCTVQGIDLSQSFVDAANFLGEGSGLQGKVGYRHGNALSPPVSSGTLGVAWTQHIAMNIVDRAALYSESFRVLWRGGRLAIFDVIAASDSPLHFPIPWAHGSGTSFLATSDEMRAELSAQGFRIASWTDCTAAGITWFLEREHERPRSATPPRSWQGAGMGPAFAVATVNLPQFKRGARGAYPSCLREAVSTLGRIFVEPIVGLSCERLAGGSELHSAGVGLRHEWNGL
jgi:sarcosine/dimethylglycine N-methyltransferase